MKYDSNIRDKNAELVIETIRETTTFEGMYDLFEKLPNELSYLGHRIHECGKVFTDKLVKLARTETQVLIAILTLRGGWDLCYSYNTKILKPSAESVYWHILPYLKKQFKVEVAQRLIEPKYSSAQYEEYLLKKEKYLLDIKNVTERYSRFINPKEKEVQKSITRLAQKLKTYKSCKLVFTSSPNSEAGLVLLKKMVISVDESNLEEILYCFSTVANRKEFPIDSTQWCRLLGAMMKLHRNTP